MGDRRLGEAWSRWQTLKNATIWVLVRVLLFSLIRLPTRARRSLAQSLARTVHQVWRSGRVRTQQRLHAAYGESCPVSSEQVFQSVAGQWSDSLELLHDEFSAADALPIEPSSRRLLDALLVARRGVVFATVHTGTMDLMAASVAEHGYPVWTLSRESYDPRLTDLITRVRSRRGVREVYRGHPTMVRNVCKALRRGEVVGFPMDFAGRGMRTRSFRFLGSDRALAVGPARLALRMGAAIVVGSVQVREQGPQIELEQVTAGELGGEAADTLLTARIAKTLEEHVRRAPEGWFWMHT